MMVFVRCCCRQGVMASFVGEMDVVYGGSGELFCFSKTSKRVCVAKVTRSRRCVTLCIVLLRSLGILMLRQAKAKAEHGLVCTVHEEDQKKIIR